MTGLLAAGLLIGVVLVGWAGVSLLLAIEDYFRK